MQILARQSWHSNYTGEGRTNGWLDPDQTGLLATLRRLRGFSAATPLRLRGLAPSELCLLPISY